MDLLNKRGKLHVHVLRTGTLVLGIVKLPLITLFCKILGNEFCKIYTIHWLSIKTSWL